MDLYGGPTPYPWMNPMEAERWRYFYWASNRWLQDNWPCRSSWGYHLLLDVISRTSSLARNYPPVPLPGACFLARQCTIALWKVDQGMSDIRGIRRQSIDEQASIFTKLEPHWEALGYSQARHLRRWKTIFFLKGDMRS